MRFSEHNVVATFDDAEQARAALVLLERTGVEAGDIELTGPGMQAADRPMTNDEQRNADVRAATTVERRGLAGAVIVGVIAAVVAGVIAAVVSGGSGTPILAAALAAFLLFGAVGALWGGFSGLAANEQWGETFQTGGGETSVAVHTPDPDRVGDIVSTLRGAHPTRLATCGRDGQLRDVA